MGSTLGNPTRKAEEETDTTPGVTALWVAAMNGEVALVVALLAKCTRRWEALDLAEAATGATPLFVAAQNGHAAVVAVLLAEGAQVDKARNDGATPLLIAAQDGHAPVVAALLSKGARIDVTFKGYSPLKIAKQNRHTAVVTMLTTTTDARNAEMLGRLIRLKYFAAC